MLDTAGMTGSARMESETSATFGSIDEKFRGNVVSPEKPFFLVSGKLFVRVQRRLPLPSQKDFVERMKEPGNLLITDISLSKTREPWHGFKDQQQASNYYWATRAFNPHMALSIVEVKEVHAHVEAIAAVPEFDPEDC